MMSVLATLGMLVTSFSVSANGYSPWALDSNLELQLNYDYSDYRLNSLPQDNISLVDSSEFTLAPLGSSPHHRRTSSSGLNYSTVTVNGANSDVWSSDNFFNFDFSFDSWMPDFSNYLGYDEMETNWRHDLQAAFVKGFDVCKIEKENECEAKANDVDQHAYFRDALLSVRNSDYQVCVGLASSTCAQESFDKNIAENSNFGLLSDDNKYLLNSFLDDYKFSTEDYAHMDIDFGNLGENEKKLLDAQNRYCKVENSSPISDDFSAFDYFLFGNDQKCEQKRNGGSVQQANSFNLFNNFTVPTNALNESRPEVNDDFCNCVADDLKNGDDSKYEALKCEDVVAGTHDYLSREMKRILKEGMDVTNKGLLTALSNPEVLKNNPEMRSCMPGTTLSDGSMQIEGCKPETKSLIENELAKLVKFAMAAKMNGPRTGTQKAAEVDLSNVATLGTVIRTAMMSDGVISSEEAAVASAREVGSRFGDAVPAMARGAVHGSITDADQVNYIRDNLSKRFIIQNVVALNPNLLPEEYHNFASLSDLEKRGLVGKFNIQNFYDKLAQESEGLNVFEITDEELKLVTSIGRGVKDKQFQVRFDDLSPEQKKVFNKISAIQAIVKPNPSGQIEAFDGSQAAAKKLSEFMFNQTIEMMNNYEKANGKKPENFNAAFVNEALASASIGDAESVLADCEAIKKRVQNVCEVLQYSKPIVPGDNVELPRSSVEAKQNKSAVLSAMGDEDNNQKYHMFLCYNKLKEVQAPLSERSREFIENNEDCKYDVPSMFTADKLFSGFQNEGDLQEERDREADATEIKSMQEYVDHCVSVSQEDETTADVCREQYKGYLNNHLHNYFVSKISEDGELPFEGRDDYINQCLERVGGAQNRSHCEQAFNSWLSSNNVQDENSYRNDCQTRHRNSVDRMASCIQNYDNYLKGRISAVYNEADQVAGDNIIAQFIEESTGQQFSSATDPVDLVRTAKQQLEIRPSSGSSQFLEDGLDRLDSSNGSLIPASGIIANTNNSGSGAIDDGEESGLEAMNRVSREIASTIAAPNNAVSSSFSSSLNSLGNNITADGVKTAAARALDKSDELIDQKSADLEAAQAAAAANPNAANDARVDELMKELAALRDQQKSLQGLLDDERAQRQIAEQRRESANTRTAEATRNRERNDALARRNNALAGGGGTSGGGGNNDRANVVASVGGGGGANTAVAAAGGGGGNDGGRTFTPTNNVSRGDFIVAGSTATLTLSSGESALYYTQKPNENWGVADIMQKINLSPSKTIIAKLSDGSVVQYSIGPDGSLITKPAKVDENGVAIVDETILNVTAARKPASEEAEEVIEPANDERRGRGVKKVDLDALFNQ